MSNLFVHIGQQIQKHLQESGMTQSDLASAIGVSRQVMSKIVNGKKAINVEEISKIANIIGKPIEELLNDETNGPEVEEPVLLMMGSVSNGNTVDDLGFLNHVIDEMIDLDEVLKA